MIKLWHCLLLKRNRKQMASYEKKDQEKRLLFHLSCYVVSIQPQDIFTVSINRYLVTANFRCFVNLRYSIVQFGLIGQCVPQHVCLLLQWTKNELFALSFWKRLLKGEIRHIKLVQMSAYFTSKKISFSLKLIQIGKTSFLLVLKFSNFFYKYDILLK